jgi:RNA polymerase sigma-70 factor (ECF subfamily)
MEEPSMQVDAPAEPSPEASDEEVVARVRAGDTARFEILMRRYNQRLFRAARSIIKSDAEAEDVIQEAYVQAYAHLHEFEGRARFSTWLTKIAVHEALARVRQQSKFGSIPDGDGEHMEEPEGRSADPEQAASASELAHAVEHAIDLLPETFRTVFMLRAVEELSVAETAECLGIPEETVKTRLHRARAQLQKQIEARTESAVRQAHRFLFERCDRLVVAVLRRIGAPPPP